MKAVVLSSAVTPTACEEAEAEPRCLEGCNLVLAVLSAEVCLPQLQGRARGSVPAQLLSSSLLVPTQNVQWWKSAECCDTASVQLRQACRIFLSEIQAE